LGVVKEFGLVAQYKRLDDVSGLLSTFADFVKQAEFGDFQWLELGGLDFRGGSEGDREFHSNIAVFFDFEFFLFDCLGVFEGKLVADMGEWVGSLGGFVDEL
jgi:hypothetical protein